MSTIRLQGWDIDGNQTSCTLAQLIIVFQALAQCDSMRDLAWYAADISPPVGALAPYRSQILSQIGTIDRLIELLGLVSTPQLDFAVFIGLPRSAHQKILYERVSTEGPSRKRMAASKIEVIVFDSTYLEITADRDDIVQSLKTRFSGCQPRG